MFSSAYMFVKKIFLALGAVLKEELILPSLHRATARSRYAFMFTNDWNLVKLVKNLLISDRKLFDKTYVPNFFLQ